MSGLDKRRLALAGFLSATEPWRSEFAVQLAKAGAAPSDADVDAMAAALKALLLNAIRTGAQIKVSRGKSKEPTFERLSIRAFGLAAVADPPGVSEIRLLAAVVGVTGGGRQWSQYLLPGSPRPFREGMAENFCRLLYSTRAWEITSKRHSISAEDSFKILRGLLFENSVTESLMFQRALLLGDETALRSAVASPRREITQPTVARPSRDPRLQLRTEMVEEVIRQISSSRSVCLHALSGQGKTVVARQVLDSQDVSTVIGEFVLGNETLLGTETASALPSALKGFLALIIPMAPQRFASRWRHLATTLRRLIASSALAAEDRAAWEKWLAALQRAEREPTILEDLFRAVPVWHRDDQLGFAALCAALEWAGTTFAAHRQGSVTVVLIDDVWEWSPLLAALKPFLAVSGLVFIFTAQHIPNNLKQFGIETIRVSGFSDEEAMNTLVAFGATAAAAVLPTPVEPEHLRSVLVEHARIVKVALSLVENHPLSVAALGAAWGKAIADANAANFWEQRIHEFREPLGEFDLPAADVELAHSDNPRHRNLHRALRLAWQALPTESDRQRYLDLVLFGHSHIPSAICGALWSNVIRAARSLQPDRAEQQLQVFADFALLQLDVDAFRLHDRHLALVRALIETAGRGLAVRARELLIAVGALEAKTGELQPPRFPATGLGDVASVRCGSASKRDALVFHGAAPTRALAAEHFLLVHLLELAELAGNRIRGRLALGLISNLDFVLCRLNTRSPEGEDGFALLSRMIATDDHISALRSESDPDLIAQAVEISNALRLTLASLHDDREQIFAQLIGRLPRAGQSRQYISDLLRAAWRAAPSDALLPLQDTLSRRNPIVQFGRQGHSSEINVLSVAPDTARFASGGDDMILFVWDATTTEPVRRLEGHVGMIESLAFVSPGYRLVSGDDAGRLYIWELSERQGLQSIAADQGFVLSVASLGDGRHVATGGSDGTVKVWNLDSLQVVACWRGLEGAVRGLAASPTGGRLLIGAGGGQLGLWDVFRDRKVLLPAHQGRIRCCAFAGDGQLAVSGGDDWDLCVWDLNEEHLKYKLRGHRGVIWCVDVTKSGRFAVTGGDDHVLRVWDLLEPKAKPKLITGHPNARVWAARFLSDNELISAGSDAIVYMWSRSDGQLLRTFANPPADFSIQGSEAPQPKGRSRFEIGGVNALGFLDALNSICTGGDDGIIRIFACGSMGEVTSYYEHLATVRALTVLPDGRSVVSGDDQGRLLLRDIGADGIHEISISGPGYRKLVTLEDHNSFVSLDAQGQLGLWSLQTPLVEFRPGSDRVSAVCKGPKGCLVIGFTDGSLGIVNLSDCRLYERVRGLAATISALAYDPIRGRVVIGDLYGNVSIRCHSRLERSEWSCSAHKGKVNAVLPWDTKIVTCGDDRAIKIIDPTTDSVSTVMVSGGAVTSVVTDGTQRRIAASDTLGSGHLSTNKIICSDFSLFLGTYDIPSLEVENGRT